MAKTPRMAQIEALLEADPTDVMTRYMLGMEHASGGDDEAAVAVLKPLAAEAKYVPAFHMCGQALARLGRVPEACEVLREGIVMAGAQGNTHAAGEMQGLLDSIE